MRHVVYFSGEWKYMLLAQLLPEACLIHAKFGESPEDVISQLPEDTRSFWFHLDLSFTRAMPNGRQQLIDTLKLLDIAVFNASVDDIRKSTIQSYCQRYGLNYTRADQDGASDDLLIIKSNLNYGGVSERRLSQEQLAYLQIDQPTNLIPGPLEYKINERKSIDRFCWSDPDIIVERYISNPRNIIYRAYVLLDALVISEVINPKPIKKMELGLPRKNHLLIREGEGYRACSSNSAVPDKLLKQMWLFIQVFRLDFGTIDIVMSDKGEHYIVDVNVTPYWGKERQSGLLTHLSQAMASYVS